MYRDLRQRFWWTRMKRDIARFVAECDVCRRVKAEHQRPAGALQPLPIPKWKWDKVSMDFITGFPKTQKGNDAIFVTLKSCSLPSNSRVYYCQSVSRLVCVESRITSWCSFGN